MSILKSLQDLHMVSLPMYIVTCTMYILRAYIPAYIKITYIPLNKCDDGNRDLSAVLVQGGGVSIWSLSVMWIRIRWDPHSFGSVNLKGTDMKIFFFS